MRHLRHAAVLALLVACAVGLVAGEGSLRTLTRGDLRIDLALPDRAAGHYRGIRFDHGGIVTQASLRGHTFFGLLKPPHRPEAHDGAAGAPEEFHLASPPGFAEAADGGQFLKIGVGALIRPNRKGYLFRLPYEVASWATWTVVEAPEAITCSHDAKAGAFAVHGSRTIRLLPDGDGFAIDRELRNTGAVELPVEHYNHAMIIFDGKPIGPGYSLTYAAPVTAAHRSLAVEGATLRLLEEPAGHVHTAIDGLPGTPGAASLRIANAGAWLELSGDTTPAKIALYAERTALCPEFFVRFVLRPGESRRWSQTFRFGAPASR